MRPSKPLTPVIRFLVAGVILLCPAAMTCAAPPGSETPRKPVRVGTAQPKNRTIDFRLKPADALAQVDKTLDQLEGMVNKAGQAGCDVLALPEDTLGLLKWVAANPDHHKDVLPAAVKGMLDRLGRAAAKHRMYLVCCNDALDADGALRNTAFFIGRDGREIGRYDKVQPTIHEARKRGDRFPVFPTPDLGGVGMLICYDMVFPEAARCLALGGADIIFHPTLGGAAIGDEDVSRAAFRTRAVENFVYVVVSHRGRGSMVISPQGKVLAEGKEPDDIAIVDIDPFGGRAGGDAFNHQTDMRARLFRERNPAAYGPLTDPEPPVLKKVPATVKPAEVARIAERALTVGEDEFRAAEALARSGKTAEAMAAFEKLRADYRGSWIDRVSRERLARLGIAAGYAGDAGIARDPRVLFAEDFEAGTLDELAKRWNDVSNKGGAVMAFRDDVPPGSAGNRSLQVTATPGTDTGGHLFKRLTKSVDKLHARFYVKFAEDAGYTHHFVALGGHHPPSNWPHPKAGERPNGDDRIYIGIEPHGGRDLPPPGAWSFYNYWHEMKKSADGRYWGNAIRPETPLQTPRGRWQCVEVMARLNSAPDAADGELALWLDGDRVMNIAKGTRRGPWSGMGFGLPKEGGEPFEGFRWRTSRDLQLNWFWLLHYVTEAAVRRNGQADPARPCRVWFDDVVVATEYIGPIQGGKKP
jgi:predicted amidohydrolase